MKKISSALMLLLACGFAVIFASCTADPYADPYKDYVSSEIEPKTKIGPLTIDDERWYAPEQKTEVFTSYSDFINFGADLGYTEAYFENNRLLLFLRTGCSTDNLKFVDILEQGGVLCPVLEINPYRKGDPVSEDIIFYIFYAEIPADGNYTIGEVITRTRPHKVVS